MKSVNRLRKRIEKAMQRDLQRQKERPEETVMNAFAFVMDMNRAILKTVSELVIDLEKLERAQRARQRQ